MATIADIASKWNLKHRPWPRNEYRGDCPVCDYANAFVLCEKDGKVLGWCASCKNTDGIGAKLMEFLGKDKKDQAEPVASAETPETVRARQAAREQAAAQARERASAIWGACKPLRDTAADRYLRGRGLSWLAVAPPPTLRFHPHLYHSWTQQHFPALVGLVTDVENRAIAIHRTWLAEDGSGKAPVEPARGSLGPVEGGSIRLTQMFTGQAEVAIAEGIETAASLCNILALPAWAAVSAGNMAERLMLPPQIEYVHIGVDNDENEAGQTAAQAAAKRWYAEGRKVILYTPRKVGSDFNDVTQAYAGVN